MYYLLVGLDANKLLPEPAVKLVSQTTVDKQRLRLTLVAEDLNPQKPWLRACFPGPLCLTKNKYSPKLRARTNDALTLQHRLAEYLDWVDQHAIRLKRSSRLDYLDCIHLHCVRKPSNSSQKDFRSLRRWHTGAPPNRGLFRWRVPLCDDALRIVSGLGEPRWVKFEVVVCCHTKAEEG